MNELENNPAGRAMILPDWVVRPTLFIQLQVGSSFLLVWLIAELLAQKFVTAGGVSAWYPTAGLGVALLWALGLRYTWAIFAAALLSAVTVWEYALVPAVLTSAVKAGTYGGAALLLRRAIAPGRLPPRPVRVGAMIAALVGCAVATASLSIGLLVLTEQVNSVDAADAVVGWMIGDAVGLLVIAPLIVVVIAPWACLALCKKSDEAKTTYARAIGVYEVVPGLLPWGIVVGAPMFLAALFCLPEQCDPRTYYLGFIALPAIAMRYRLVGGLIALLLVSFTAALVASIQKISPPAFMDLQLIVLALAISTVLVGWFAVMRTAAEEQRQAEHRWAVLAMRGSGMGRWNWEVGSDRLQTDYTLTDAFGYRRDQVAQAINWWEQRIHPEDVLLNKREMKKLLTGQSDYFEVDNRMLADDGAWGWYHSQGTIIERDTQGNPTRVAGIHEDITERKELERIRADAEATHRSEQRFRTLADGAPVAIFQTDAKGVYLYVNPAWQAMTGMEQTDALYRAASAFTHTEDRNAVSDHWDAAIRTAGSVSIEHRVVTPDGQALWLQTQATPMNHNGVLLGFVGTSVDVTPYRNAMAMIRDSEARYRTLADHAYDMLWRVTADAEFTYVSPGVIKLLGYRPDQMVGTNAFDYFHPEDIEQVREKHAALTPDEPEFHDLHRYRRADGTYIVFEAVGRLVVPDGSQEGEPTEPYITGISRDVTQRVEGERIRRELEEKLARSQKLDAIGTFATGIAHDFRNSLLAIKASAQSVGRKLNDDHPARPALGTVDDACAQAMAVTQSLLTFARGQGAAKRPTDLAELVRDNARLLETIIPPQVDLTQTCPDSPVRVLANASEMQQALLNLVMNARDAIEGQGRIAVTLARKDDTAVLAVRDNGAGMPREVLDRALEPFYTTKARLKGTGLGLSQVHGIVTDHNGEIALDSAPGIGTTITITLPLHQTPTPHQPVTKAAQP